MTTMDRLTDLLGDVDELLDDADAQTITESLERGEAPDHAEVDSGCPWCGHGFHGLACYRPPEYTGTGCWCGCTDDNVDDYALQLTEAGGGHWPCGCDGSLARPDDTWRPGIFDSSLHEHLGVMHETGMDGWAARAEVFLRRRAHYEEVLRARQEAHEQQRRENQNRQLSRWMDETGLDGWAAAADRARSVPSLSARSMAVDLRVSMDQVAISRFVSGAEQLGAMAEIVVGQVMAGTVSFAELVADAGGITVRRPDFRRGRIGAWVDEPSTPAPDPLPLADWERALVELPQEPEFTVQERALQLRRDRNTGPERPTAGRARRPRRHGG